MILVKNGIRQFQTVYSVPVYTLTCKYCEAVFEAEKGEISIIHNELQKPVRCPYCGKWHMEYVVNDVRNVEKFAEDIFEYSPEYVRKTIEIKD